MNLVTARQAAFIEKLAAERPSLVTVTDNSGVPALASLFAACRAGDLSQRDASLLIDQLLSHPKEKQEAEPVTRTVTPALEEAFYVLDDDIYRVVTAKTSGRKYAKVLKVFEAADGSHRGRWEYAAGVIFHLSEDNRVTAEIAATWGHAWGLCCFCGATLTDPRSAELGYGPVCAKKHLA